MTLTLNLTNQNPNKDKHNPFRKNHSNNNQHFTNNKVKTILEILPIFQNLKPQLQMTMFLAILYLDLMTPSNNQPKLNNKYQINSSKNLNQTLLETFNSIINHFFNSLLNSNNNNNWLSNQSLNILLKLIY